jgi:hypothetical protein
MKDVVQQIQITVVPPAVVDVVWPEAKEMLLRAVQTSHIRGVYDIDSVSAGLDFGRICAFWLVLDAAPPIAALTTRICDYPNGRGLALDWMGGERMSEWLPMAQDRSWSGMLGTTAALTSKGMAERHGGAGSRNTGGSPPI